MAAIYFSKVTLIFLLQYCDLGQFRMRIITSPLNLDWTFSSLFPYETIPPGDPFYGKLSHVLLLVVNTTELRPVSYCGHPS